MTARGRGASKSKAKSKPKAAPRRAKAAPKTKATPRAKAAPKPAKPTPKRAKAAPKRAKPAPKRAKHYKLTAGELVPVAEGHGACIASDQITVDGHPVRFMYREAPIHDVDSGWRFFSGRESEAYMNDMSNHGFYDCNTIANYDRSIVLHLDEPIGSAFEKPPGATSFQPVTDWTPPKD